MSLAGLLQPLCCPAAFPADMPSLLAVCAGTTGLEPSPAPAAVPACSTVDNMPRQTDAHA